MNVPGLKFAVPTSPADAKGLLKSAIRGEDPVIFFEHKMLYAERGPCPRSRIMWCPLGKPRCCARAAIVTLIAIGVMVPKALEAAETLAEEGISTEVIDPRTLVPLDKEALIQSVAKTSRVIIAHEAHRRSGPGAEIAAMLAEEAIEYLDGPIVRVAARNVPLPYSPILEDFVLPDVQDIIAAARSFFPAARS